MLTSVQDIALVLELHRRAGEQRLSAAMMAQDEPELTGRLSAAAEQLHIQARPAELRMAEKLHSEGAFVLVRGWPPYPERLASDTVDEAPLLLYCKGRLDLLSLPMVAVIGTRRPSLLGRSIARGYTRQLVEHFGMVIVSGNASGIDSAAHEEALLAGGSTVFFPAVPLDAWKPEFHLPPHAMDRVLVASPFVPGSATHPYCFLRRNSLVASMCQAALVAETGTRGGTLDTVAKLKRLRRPTFGVDFPPDSRRHEAHRLLFAGGVSPIPHQVSRGAAELLASAQPEEETRQGSHSEEDLFRTPAAQDAEPDQEWYRSAFGADYLSLYAHRDEAEATAAAGLICQTIGLAQGASVLDAPCGAGRHARVFAALGMRVVGLDLSADLLHSALQESKGEAHAAPAYLRGDIRQIPLRAATFDLVTNLFSSFGYFPTDEENAKMLEGLAALVKPGGHLVLDFMNSERVQSTLQPRTERTTPGGWHITEERWLEGPPLRINKRTVAQSDCGARKEFRESVRLFTPEELEQMMKNCGVPVVHEFGSYQGGERSLDASRVLLIGRKS